MSETNPPESVATPWHVWVIGVISLLWNAMGALDYVMTKTQDPAYVSHFTPEQLEFFYGFPSWVVAAWAIAVWGGVLGSVLLLLRNQYAVLVFGASLLGMVITTVHNFGLSNGLEVMGDPASLAFTAVIFLVALGLFVYAHKLRRRGVLR